MLTSDELFATKILLQHGPQEKQIILVGDKHDFHAYPKIDCVYIDVITKQEYDFLTKQKGARVVTNQWSRDHVYSKDLQRPLCISQLVAADLSVESQYTADDTLSQLQIYHMDSEHRTKRSCLVNYRIINEKSEVEAIEQFAYWEQLVIGTEQFHTFRIGRMFVPAYSYDIPIKDEANVQSLYETIFYMHKEDLEIDVRTEKDHRVKYEHRDRDALQLVFMSVGERNLEIWMRKRVKTGDEEVILQAIQRTLRAKGLASTIMSPERFVVHDATREKVLSILSDVG